MFKIYSFKIFSFFSITRQRVAGWLVGAVLMIASLPGQALAAGGAIPSTFGSTVGQALLCVDQIDPFYFWSYMNQFFGPPYKTEGGAYWFKVQGTLWGANITDVMVSDGAGEQVFLAASFKDNPAKLASAIAETRGMRYVNEEPSQYSPLVSHMGSRIVYSGQGSKIYCAKYNLDHMRR